MTEDSLSYDVLIVGGGPAGLSAALVLGRCRRRVLLCDAGQPRNAASQHLHGYLTRDGVNPGEFIRAGRSELGRYDTVEIRDVHVTGAQCQASTFSASLATGETVRSRKLLLATGVVDNLPQIEGIRELYGKSIFHCPYCDGWEIRDQPIAVYGRGERGCGLSLELTGWTRDLVLLTDGPSELDPEHREQLARNGVAVHEERLTRLEGRDGILQRIHFEGGGWLTRRAMFFTTGQEQRSHLAVSLGCEFNDKGTVPTGKYETTHLPGLYVAGDASRAVQWVIVAAAEGAEAAFSINQALIKEDLA
jgi:thioredoxin reductase